MSARVALLGGLAGLGLASGCASLNRTVVREVTWEPAQFHEVSRAPGPLELKLEVADGERWASVVERWDCIEEATQRGLEVEERRPQDWVLGVSTVVAGSATAVGIGLAGGALVNTLTGSAQDRGSSVAGQVVATGVGIVGAFGQLLAYKKIVEGVSSIRFRREDPVQQFLGRKVRCDERQVEGTLHGDGLPEQGLALAPRAKLPEGFVLEAARLTLGGRPVEVPGAQPEER